MVEYSFLSISQTCLLGATTRDPAAYPRGGGFLPATEPVVKGWGKTAATDRRGGRKACRSTIKASLNSVLDIEVSINEMFGLAVDVGLTIQGSRVRTSPGVWAPLYPWARYLTRNCPTRLRCINWKFSCKVGQYSHWGNFANFSHVMQFFSENC